MLKKMICPNCGTELENDARWADVDEGFQCVNCDLDFDANGNEIVECSEDEARDYEMTSFMNDKAARKSYEWGDK